MAKPNRLPDLMAKAEKRGIEVDTSLAPEELEVELRKILEKKPKTEK